MNEEHVQEKIKDLFNAVMGLNGLKQNGSPCVFFEVSPHVALISISYFLSGWVSGAAPNRKIHFHYDNDPQEVISLINREIFFIKTLRRRDKNAC